MWEHRPPCKTPKLNKSANSHLMSACDAGSFAITSSQTGRGYASLKQSVYAEYLVGCPGKSQNFPHKYK